jgi:hypothetical protein
MRVPPLQFEFVGRTRCTQICWEGLAKFAEKIPGNSDFRLIASAAPLVSEFGFREDVHNQVLSSIWYLGL